jgi:hypothetical protein
MGEVSSEYIWSEKLEGKYHLKDLVTDGRTTLKWIFEKPGVRLWIGFI